MERGGSPPQPVVAPTGVPPPEFIRQEGIEGNPSPQRLQTESHSIVSNYTVHGILRARILGLSLLQGIIPIEESNPGLPHCRWILYQLSTRETQGYCSG